MRAPNRTTSPRTTGDYRLSTNWPLKTVGSVSMAVLLTNVFQVDVSVPVILLPLTVPVRAPATT